MAIDVTIKQKIFGNKTMPLEIILGDDLHYGTFENDHLNVGVIGDCEFIAYNPNHIGRGFSVIWNPYEKKEIQLRLPMPSTTQELSDFYDSVARITNYWKGKLTVDGNNINLEHFLAEFDNMVEFNNMVIKQSAQEVISGQHETLTLYSAMWPMSMGKKEAKNILKSPDEYAVWLHTKQSVDACYAFPRFYDDKGEILGRYIFMNGVSCIFPEKPIILFGAIDPSTGKPLACNDWKVILLLDGEREPLCEIEYFEFVKSIPEHKCTKYDGNKILISEMNESEIRSLIRE